MEIVVYQEKYKNQIIKLFEDFQNYLIKLDPLKRLRRLPGYGENVIKDTLKEISEKDGIFYLAVEEDRVLGFIVGVLEKMTEEDLRSAYPVLKGRVTELYVIPESRSKGLGKALMDKMEQYFKDKDCNYIWIEVFVPNELAHSFYLKNGYHDRDIEMVKKL